MSISLWSNGHEWAVCDGVGPLNVVGYLLPHPQGGWAIKEDSENRHFTNQWTAAVAVVGRDVSDDFLSYTLGKNDETVTVVASPETCARIVSEEGWNRIFAERPGSDLK